MRAALGTVLVAALLTACGTTPIRPAATSEATGLPPSTPPPTPTPTATATASPTATPTACTPLAAVDAWPPARRAAQLLIVPAKDGQVAALGSSYAQGVGGVLMIGSTPGDLRAQVTAAQGASRLPLLVMTDQEGGGIQRLGSLVSSMPWPRDMARTMTPAAVESLAATVGAQMKALGVSMDLAPVLDLDDRPGPSAQNPDGSRSFSIDAGVASTYGLAFARGLQRGGVLPVVKHFPGLGGGTTNTDYGAATTLPYSTLQGAGLLPFQAAVKAGMPAVMVANATVPGLTSGPASLSSAAIDGLLRTRLGFHGLVLTDSISAGAVSAAGYTLPSAFVAAVGAGADMVMFGSTLNADQAALLTPPDVAASVGSLVNALVAAVQGGRVSTARLDDAVLHVLAIKGINACSLH